jgi:hypothetical protein
LYRTPRTMVQTLLGISVWPAARIQSIYLSFSWEMASRLLNGSNKWAERVLHMATLYFVCKLCIHCFLMLGTCHCRLGTRAGSDYVQVKRRSITFLDQIMWRGEVFGLKKVY